ncbi:MAG: UDP-N-acetylglucosamine 2-epimerase (non-hydrolyzing) [Desulfobulbaceae bacterium]|nr:UDP-N-acetylglucosamine 2-epimerase (non-hydrolyzing) [Desulfobulbaceae bacterium]
MKLMSIAGARPNFMKIASIAKAIENYNNNLPATAALQSKIDHVLVHTGQHYDKKMSQSFFDDLGIPQPDINLEVGSGSHAHQTAEIMRAFEPVLLRESPDILLVVGDVNSTIACCLVGSKIQYTAESKRERPVIVHVEAGLRSYDRSMPEEVNRILTDSLSDVLFITEESAKDNLLKEGIVSEKIHFSGNVMIDTLKNHLKHAEKSGIKQDLGVSSLYGLVTLHRPSNVDSPEILKDLVDTLLTISKKKSLVFPVHPRTRNNLERFSLYSKLEESSDIILSGPLPYLDFLNLTMGADLVITDSGGIQEETTYLNIPCVTLRENTERPVTVDVGSNYLIGTDKERILQTTDIILSGQGKKGTIPKFWDGKSGERIIATLVSLNNNF